MSRGPHDLGGMSAGAIDRSEAPTPYWARRLEAMRDCLARQSPPVMYVDEMRRGIEALQPEVYDALAVYERKAEAIRAVLVERGLLDATELARRIAMLRESCAEHPHAHDDDDDASPEPDRHELLVEAMIEQLIAAGLLDPAALGAQLAAMDQAGPAQGARAVARAWIDPAFKKRLLADGKVALAELGIASTETQLIVLENTPRLHNVVVCTLCSCYPRSVLGSPPAWYVSKPYRARAVREPRQVLAEFGTVLDPAIEVRVHDSTANMRYMVLPMRPAGTESWTETALAELVSRDSLIGVSPARAP